MMASEMPIRYEIPPCMKTPACLVGYSQCPRYKFWQAIYSTAGSLVLADGGLLS